MIRSTVVAFMIVLAAGGCSEPEPVTPPAPPSPPSDLENLSWRRVGTHAVEISWVDSGGPPAAYLVERAVGSSQVFVERAQVPNTQRSFVDTFATYGTYGYRIQPIPTTDPNQAHYVGPIFLWDPVPDELTVNEHRPGVIQVTWPTSVEGTAIVRRHWNGGPSEVVTVGSSSVVFDTLKEFGLHQYSMQAIFERDSSEVRFSRSIRIASPYLQNVSAEISYDETVALMWSPVSTLATLVVVERSFDGGAYQPVAIIPSAALSVADTIRQLGTFQYRIHSATTQSRSDDLELPAVHIDGWFPGRPRALRYSDGNFVSLPTGDILHYGFDGSEIYRRRTSAWEQLSASSALDAAGQYVFLSTGNLLNGLGAPMTSSPGQQPQWRNDIFDVVSGTWIRQGAVNAQLLTSVFLRLMAMPDGSALYIGSTVNPMVASMVPVPFVERFNPIASVFSSLSAPPNLGNGYSANLLADGTVLVAGGRLTSLSEYRDSCWLFDPVNNLWSETTPMSAPRAIHEAITLGNGMRVLVILEDGGCEYYEAGTRAWYPAPALPDQRIFSSTQVHADTLYAIIGNTAAPSAGIYEYNRTDNRWKLVTGIPTTLIREPSVLRHLFDGRLLVIINDSEQTQVFSPRLR